MPAKSIVSPNRPRGGTNIISKVTMSWLYVDERDQMRSVSAVADSRDAMEATAPPFKFDFVAFLNNFSARFYIFVSVVPSPSASDSISAFLAVSFEKIRTFLVHTPFQKFSKRASGLVIRMKE